MSRVYNTSKEDLFATVLSESGGLGVDVIVDEGTAPFPSLPSSASLSILFLDSPPFHFLLAFCFVSHILSCPSLPFPKPYLGVSSIELQA